MQQSQKKKKKPVRNVIKEILTIPRENGLNDLYTLFQLQNSVIQLSSRVILAACYTNAAIIRVLVKLLLFYRPHELIKL